MILQLNPTIDVKTPLGDCEVMFIIDYGINANTVWCGRMSGGEIKHFYSDQIKIYDNPMNEKGWDVNKKDTEFSNDSLIKKRFDIDTPKENNAGIDLIAKERLEQLLKHGKTIEYDVEKNNLGELCMGAIALLENNKNGFSRFWNKEICDKMYSKSYKDRLIIAGAFIAAEIDRVMAINKFQSVL